MKLGFTDGCENPAGIAEKAYWIPASYFEEIKKPTESTTAASLVTITGDHVLKAGKAPIEVSMLYNKSGANSTLEGEDLSKINNSSVEIFIPSITASNLGTAKILKNQRGILLFKGAEGGNTFYQLGTEDIFASVSAMDTNFGVGPTGEKGIRVTISAYGSAPFHVYNGSLPAPAPVGG